MITFVLIIIVISVLILGHEWGHFFSARRLGVRVDEFGFGFPPRVFSRVKNKVRYSLNLLPFGGFVKIYGEHGEGENMRESFASRAAWQRILILGAGVAMNFVLAWLAFSIAAGIGVPAVADAGAGIPVSVLEVVPGSPAEKAGIKFGDTIMEMRTADVSLRIESEKDVIDFTDAYRGEDITMVVGRQGSVREIHVTPRPHAPDGEGPLGIMLGRIMIHKVPWYMAPLEGLWSLWMSIAGISVGLWQMVISLLARRGAGVAVSGPIGIFFFAGDARQLGAAYFLQFVGVLSVNLALLNILPIPALDGGRIFFIILEKIRGKKMSERTENAAHAAGFIALIILMLFITGRDILRLL